MPFLIEPSTEISHRCDFSLLCNARGYKDAVEIGTDQGVFAREFLSRFKGNWLVCVDPYEPYPERPYDRSADRVVAITALMPWHGRFRFIGARSPSCIPWILTFIRPPQFVYIDADHEYESVLTDISAWWDASDPQGMIAGHDFDESHPGVVRAVQEFARERELVVRLTDEPECKSWYIYKTEPERLIRQYFARGEAPNPHHAAE